MNIAKVPVCVVSICVIFWIAGSAVAADSLYGDMKSFLDENFVGEGFIPVPYGADDRFSPKTVWILAENAQKKAWKTGTRKAWVAFSDGRGIYSDELAPTRIREISTQDWDLDVSTKWTLAAALSGNLAGDDAEAGIGFVRSQGVEIDVHLKRVEIEYVYYMDMLFSQEMNAANLGIMNRLLEQRFGDEIPKRRVILAALRVKDSDVTVKKESLLDLSAEANVKVQQVLADLGFSYAKEKDSDKSLSVKGWRYIAYQAMIADPGTGKISTAPTADQGDMVASPGENWNEVTMAPRSGDE
jgi:citrate lyase gamma subunit